MTRGGRRAAAALLLAAGVLFGGRALATFLADRWWFEAAAPDTVPFFLRRTLLRAALDLWAVLLASLWWAGHAVALVAAATSPLAGGGGNPTVRRALLHPDARLWAVVLACALGVLMGLGAAEWADPILLAWQGVRFGVVDPALGVDLGVLIAGLPVWLRLHAFISLLTVSTTGVVVAGHFLAGTIRIGQGRVALSEAGRRQLGLLLAVLAAVLVGQQILSPYEVAAGLAGTVEPKVVLVHRSVGFVLVGVGLAVVALSMLWAFRPIHSLAAGGWLALTASLIAAFFFLPEGGPWPASPEEHALRNRLERVAYGFEPREGDLPAQSLSRPSLWDGEVVRTLTTGDSSGPFPVRLLLSSDRMRPAWVGQRMGSDGGLHLLAVADDTVGPGGRPLFLRGTGPASLGDAAMPIASLPPLGVRPGAPPLVVESGPGGIPLGGWPRRVLLSWALQSGTLLRRGSQEHGDWHLSPTARLARVAPFAVWREPRLALVRDEPVWIAMGVITSETFPGTRRGDWEGRRVSYARVGLVGLVQAVTGATTVYLHPDADSVSVAWSRVAREVVQPASRLPAWFLSVLGPSPARPEPLAAFWTDSEAERLGRPEGELEALAPLDHGTSITVAVVDRRSGRLHAVLEQRRESGRALAVYRPDSVGLEAPAVLERRWARFPMLQIIRDSVTLTGSRDMAGQVRYVPTPGGLLAYQPIWGVAPSGQAALVVVAVAQRNLLGVGRGLGEALRNLTGDEAQETGPGEGESAILFDARRLLREADSALRRGDLVAFARAFAALRNLLEGSSTRSRAP